MVLRAGHARIDDGQKRIDDGQKRTVSGLMNHGGPASLCDAGLLAVPIVETNHDCKHRA